VEIAWALPGKAARDFRRASARTVCRVLGGDLSLAAEIEAQHDSLQQLEGGRAAQGFLLNDGAQRSTSDLPLELQIATAAQKSAYFDLCLLEKQQQLEERRMYKHHCYQRCEINIYRGASEVTILDLY